MKKIYIIIFSLIALFSIASCNDNLDQSPDRILTDEQVYSDPNLIKSTIANLYDRISWGQHVGGDMYDYTLGDEAIRYNYDDIRDFDRNRWRTYDYTLVRNVNEFIKGIIEISTLPDKEKNELIAEVRFIRAWHYFCMGRGLGGMPIVYDEVFEYTPGMDVESLQKPRSTEIGLYDYIINECDSIAKVLSVGKNKNSSRTNSWVAKMLKARVALYAASIAKYNNQMVNPLRTSGGEVGIEASKAEAYYKIALEVAEDVINNSPYDLQRRRLDDKARNFYEATSVKDSNTEVIWACDYVFPGKTHGFTRINIASSLAKDNDCSYISVLLNLAEEFEPINTTTPGMAHKFDIGNLDAKNPHFFDTADELFKDRDPRLNGTILYPGALFNGEEIALQAGLVKINGTNWEVLHGAKSEMDTTVHPNELITSQNGPVNISAERIVNKSGFMIRKFLDETNQAGTIGRGSEMWGVRFRVSEAYMIATEAAFELENKALALNYINEVRDRAGVTPLSDITFDNIVHERRVEFAFEDHRIWDLKRWRLADKLWTGNSSDVSAQRRGLWPYRVYNPSNPDQHLKWVFAEKNMNFIYPNPLHFELKHYYQELDNTWLNNNPKLVKNPYQ